jgi:hypothetical protein
MRGVAIEPSEGEDAKSTPDAALQRLRPITEKTSTECLRTMQPAVSLARSSYQLID